MTATQMPSRLTAREWSLDAYRCLGPLLASADFVISTMWPSAIKHLHIHVCNTLCKPPPSSVLFTGMRICTEMTWRLPSEATAPITEDITEHGACRTCPPAMNEQAGWGQACLHTCCCSPMDRDQGRREHSESPQHRPAVGPPHFPAASSVGSWPRSRHLLPDTLI